METDTRVGFLRGALPALLVGALFTVAVLAELPFVNGPEYWRWEWQSLPFDRAILCFAAPLAVYAFLVRRWVCAPSCDRRQAARLIAGLIVCCFAFQLAGAYVHEAPWSRIQTIVETNYITSYYTDATKIGKVRRFMRHFPRLELEYHSATHPPGPILYYFAWLKLVGAEWASRIGGVVVGLIGSLGVAGVYHTAALWERERRARLGPCFVYALLPGLIVFFPEFDQVYPLLAMLLVVSWSRAIERPRGAVAVGLTLFAITLMAYNLLTMGAFMLLYALYVLRESSQRQVVIRKLAAASALALAVFVVAHLVLHWSTSYPPWKSFMRALASQREFDARREAEGIFRPYYLTLFFDICDFLLAGGMMTLPLAAAQWARAAPARARAMTTIALGTILVVDVTGLLRCETARVWLFMQPWIVIPAGLLLAQLSGAARGIVLTLQAVIVIVVTCKMMFLA